MPPQEPSASCRRMTQDSARCRAAARSQPSGRRSYTRSARSIQVNHPFHVRSDALAGGAGPARNSSIPKLAGLTGR